MKKMRNLQALSTHWGTPKVHLQIPHDRGEIAPKVTPHGWVYAHETDDPVTCKHCLRHMNKESNK